jgi:hypothetical protein
MRQRVIETDQPNGAAMITIRFSTNKKGKRIAHYYSQRSGFRLFPISVEAAEMAIATGTLFGRPAQAE